MAIYEFKCVECEIITTEMHPMSSCPLDIDCKCGGNAVRHYGNKPASIKSSSNRSLNDIMTKRNKSAGEMMNKSWDKPAKLVDQKQLSKKEI